MKYTEFELAVIDKFVSFMNYDTLEANLDDNCTCLDIKALAKLTGFDVKTVKGIIGSLTKKNLVFVDEYNMGETALMVTDEGIREYFKLHTEKEKENMIRTIERATGVEYKAKKIEGGYEILTATGERYKKLKDSTFKRYFKVLGEAAVEEEPKVEQPAADEPEYDEPKQETKKADKAKKADQKKAEKPENKQQPVVELEGVTRENMIEKIKKMLNLSENNPSEAEGLSAALHAQKLMAKYNIHPDEVTLEEIKEDEIDSIATALKYGSSLHTWRKNLGLVVAKNFRVKCYMTGKDVVFRGFVEDVKVAVEVFTYLYTLGDKLGSKKYHEQLSATGSAKGVYNSFVIGFLHGVEAALNEQCTALMLVTPKAVEEEYKVFAEQHFKTKGQKALVEFKGGEFYEQGLTEGKAAVKSKQLDTKKNKGNKKGGKK